VGKNHPIGIFDSGIGGLTVVRTFLEKLPLEGFIYFGDTAHVPYGNKSEVQLLQYARDIMAFFSSREVKAVLVACGTHSSVTLPQIKADYPIPMVGMVKAGASAACRSTGNNRVGVLATQATVTSGAYSRAIKAIKPNCQTFEVACPGLVPLVEEGCISGEKPYAAVQHYLLPLLQQHIDTLVLGCTHYPFLSEIIHELAGPEIQLVDPAMEAVAELRAILQANDLLNSNGPQSPPQFLVSGNDASFYRVGKSLLGNIIDKVESVTLVHV
jgi:glutamate racemase